MTLAVTLLLSAIPWEFCMGGTAYGLPFPLVFPSHEDIDWYLIPIGEIEKIHTTLVSPLSLVGNLLAALALVKTGSALFRYIKSLRKQLVKPD
ncbi:hypothetical protein ONV78_15090 [Hahella sp. CR1]|uniref:hypothetical protein n=1 Tax=Hahella sp. CR1 TaxID=2992807 RepID=UPI002442C900|nr:hypothetical protein [Hahella sp. CR1]MDG9669068.1 hypothetical protein [Hahella sp. CR1]